MTAKKTDDQKHARYLVNPDTGKVELIHADDLEDKQAAGYTEPTGMTPNGAPLNGDEPEEIMARDTAAEQAKRDAEWRSDKDKKKADETEAARKEAEKNQAEQPEQADMTVRVIEDKPAKKK